MFWLSLERGYSVLVLPLVGAAAVALTAWFYRRAYRELSRRQWLGLFTLRSLALVLLVLLLFRPILSLSRDVVERRSIIFLVDTSASMATADDAGGGSRLAEACACVRAWWPELEGDYTLRLIHFADQAAALDGVDDLAALGPTGPATSLARALQSAAGAKGEKIEAVVLLSDGVHNAGGEPVPTARRLGVVVDTVGVGASLRNSPSYRDVRVAALDCPAQLVLNNQAKVVASVESVGLTGRVVQAVLEEDGAPVGRAEVTLNGTGEPQPVEFQFLPAKPGRHTYTARVDQVEGEAVAQNNHRAAVAQVEGVRIRVLYLEGALRAEYGAIVSRFLSKDPDVEFCALVQTKPNVFVQRTNIGGLDLDSIPSDPAVLDKFNVFILGDLDSSYLKPAQQKLLAGRVRGGAGLVMLGGYNSLGPGGYGGTELESVLPVALGDRQVGQVNEPFLPVLTPEGRNHLILTNIAGFFPTGEPPRQAGLPTLQGCVKVAAARPGATVLAVFPGGKDAPAGMPVLAVQPVGAGRSAVFTADTTRNWQQVPQALDQESPFTRFWGQLVRWLANRSEAVQQQAGVVARTDRAYYDPDAPVTVTATVRTGRGTGDDGAAVTATVKGPGGREQVVALARSSGVAGEYQGRFEPAGTGGYEVAVAAKSGTTELRAEPVAIEVGRANMEYDRLDLDDGLLRQISEATGGRYHHASEADRLVQGFRREQERRRVYLEQRLYWPPLFWSLFVAALVGEWGLRKRYRLR